MTDRSIEYKETLDRISRSSNRLRQFYYKYIENPPKLENVEQYLRIHSELLDIVLDAATSFDVDIPNLMRLHRLDTEEDISLLDEANKKILEIQTYIRKLNEK